MIQLNLLPDVKIEFMKLRRLERLVVSVAVVVVAVSAIVLVILSGLVYGVQKSNLHNLNKGITEYKSQIVKTPNLNKILTIQNQLAALPTLDANKKVVTRLFGYIQQLTPDNVTISNLTIDLSQNTFMIQGDTTNLAAVNQYVDIYKFAKYTTSSDSTSLNVFSNVVLSSFGLSQGQASYSINANFAPNIFSSAYSNVQINVPSQWSTRSITQLPDVKLFNNQPSSSTTTSGNQ
jgi:cell division protein FtsL